MSKLKYKPVPHDHKAFLEKASKRKGFREAYDALEEEYEQVRSSLRQPTLKRADRKALSKILKKVPSRRPLPGDEI